MKATQQKRSAATRQKLLTAAEALVATHGFAGLRTEHVVAQAGVAKGTFFAHFKNKDTLLEHLLGARLHAALDAMEDAAAPTDIDALLAVHAPYVAALTSERLAFDVALRYSGAAASDHIGPIAQAFERHIVVCAAWLVPPYFRGDVSPVLLAEGVQAFAVQAMALQFCATNATTAFETRLRTYLHAWLLPAAPAGPGAQDKPG